MKLHIGNRVVEVDQQENGIPSIRAVCEEIKYPDGRQDVIVHVPCIEISSSVKE